ncbi:MAG: NADH-quinone oxidoreductase subunit J [Acidobacteria bacterium]|nr:NADH-quinone oxidoreductase subunit J [Acidobacteriota bacterium]
MEFVVFAIFAGLTVLGALGVVVAKNPVHSAVALLVSLLSVAALFLVLWAEFIAVVQIMVYAGGVMVLFLFVIMLVDLEQRGFDLGAGRIGPRPSAFERGLWSIGGLAFGGLVAALLVRSVELPLPGADRTATMLQGPYAADGRGLGNTEWIGTLLYTDWLIPFELASVLLLVAIIGAVVLARRDRSDEFDGKGAL